MLIFAFATFNVILHISLTAIVDVMREILRALKDFARQMKEAFIAIRDLFLEISEFIFVHLRLNKIYII